MGEAWFWRPWGELLRGVQTGTPPFDELYGVDLFQYCAQHADGGALYDSAMTNATAMRATSAVAAYDFSSARTVVDVGGGQGGLLATILAAHPRARGILFDQPVVVAGAAEHLQAAGVAKRCQMSAGDFFEAVPAGGDVYTLSQIVHDWDDEQAARILAACWRAMAPGTRLLLIEQVIPAGNDPHESKFLDLHMFVMHGGRERTAEEYRALLDTAGFTLTAIVPTATPWSVIEAVRY